MPNLSIALLGPVQVTLDGEPITDFATDKTQALLVYLAVEADCPHRRDALAGLLWPDQPQRNARHNLRQALSHLRHAIADRMIAANCTDSAPFLLVSRETVQFNPDCDHWLDVAAFTSLVETCRAHRHRRPESCIPCIRRMENLVALYRGEFLEQFFLSDSSAFEEWALLKREWLHREAVEALFHLARYHERRGDYRRAQRYARRQVALEPWREEAHRQLVRLLALDGQRSAALAQYEICRRVLAEELGVEPTTETKALVERIRAQEGENAEACEHRHDPPYAHPFPLLHNLPLSPTPFVGREEDLAELAELLANPDCRLLTIFGPGGIGKTRLALRAAEEQVGAFADGCAFVPLASISSTAQFVPAIADALGIPPQSSQDPKEQIFSFLREKAALLVLDNMEHILDEAALLSAIVRRAPDVVLMVTSRERLKLQEEWVYEVHGLTYPGDGTENEDGRYSAIDLFRQRARQRNQRLQFSEVEMAQAVRICRLVEGMPLPIELAAAWATVRPCEEIAREIEQNLDILTARLRNVPERHRSIRAAFEHSWRLLTETEKDLLARLSVFRGGFRREAATAVAGASLTTLSALLDKSLIRRVPANRYDMHELLRQYATEKLRVNRQEYERTLVAHARYFAGFLAQQEPLLHGARQKEALAAIALEVENARQAWTVAVSSGWTDEIEQSLESLYRFMEIRCRFQEGVDLFAHVIDEWGKHPGQAAILGRMLSRQGALYYHLGRYPQARACLRRSLVISLALSEHLERPTEQCFCLVNLARVARSLGRYEEARQLAHRSLAVSSQHNDHWGIASSLFLLGAVEYRRGNVDQAEQLLEESLATARESGNPRLNLSPLNMLGDIACHRGKYSRGQAIFEECLALSREIGDPYSVAIHLNNLGTVFHVLERYAEARRSYEESLDICRKIGDRAGQAIALSNLGEVAYALLAHSEAEQFCQEGLAIGRSVQDQWTVMACLNNLGEIACATGNNERAKAYLAEALELAMETHTLAVLSKVLINVAVLFADEGETERAGALLSLIQRHPASEEATQEKAGRLLNEMGLAPPGEDPKSLDVVAAETLTKISLRAS